MQSLAEMLWSMHLTFAKHFDPVISGHRVIFAQPLGVL